MAVSIYINQNFNEMKIKLLVFLAAIAILSCHSPQELYKDGKFTKAYTKTLKNLKKKKSRKAKVLLNKAFIKMVEESQANMHSFGNNYRIRDIKSNLIEYRDIADYYQDGKQFLKKEARDIYTKFKTEGTDFFSEVYSMADSHMEDFGNSNNGNKRDAQKAYLLYDLLKNNGDSSSPKYRQLDKDLATSYDAAIVVYNVEMDMFFNDFRWEIERRFDDLEGESGFNVFRFNEKFDNYDCKLVLYFDDVDVDIDQSESSRTFTERILDGYDTRTDTSGHTVKKPRYVDVQGEVITLSTRKTVSWTVELVSRYNQSSDCNIRSDRFRAYEQDEAKKYQVRGDQRAIPSQYLNSSGDRLKDTKDMVEDVLDELYYEVRRYLY